MQLELKDFIRYRNFFTMSYYLADASNKHYQDGKRFGKEVACAFTASFLVSPLVSIIDKAIVQEISGIKSLMVSMGGACKEMVLKPKTFFTGLSFRLTFGVYFGTYAVANLSEALLDKYRVEGDDKRKAYKVSASSVANVSLLAWRDSIFAKAFSSDAGAAKKVTPYRTVGLFAFRDTVTMAATFYAAPKACDYLVKHQGWDKHKAEITTSLTIPVVAQFMTAPIHIHALDYFNRPVATTGERIVRIQNELGKVSFARGLRILPAFGIGSYSNTKFREMFIKHEGETEMRASGELRRRVTAWEDRLKGRKTEAAKLMANSPERKE